MASSSMRWKKTMKRRYLLAIVSLLLLALLLFFGFHFWREYSEVEDDSPQTDQGNTHYVIAKEER